MSEFKGNIFKEKTQPHISTKSTKCNRQNHFYVKGSTYQRPDTLQISEPPESMLQIIPDMICFEVLLASFAISFAFQNSWNFAKFSKSVY